MRNVLRVALLAALILIPAQSALARWSSTPTVSLTAPANGSTVSGDVTLSANATNANHVTFRVDGVAVGSDYSAPYSIQWDSTSVGDGSHTISARAANSSGTTSRLPDPSVSVTVQNAPVTTTTTPSTTTTTPSTTTTTPSTTTTTPSTTTTNPTTTTPPSPPPPPGACPVAGGNQSWRASTQTAPNEYVMSPLSDEDAIACATALGGDTLERRNVNTPYNQYQPSQAELQAFYTATDDHGATPAEGYYYPQFVTGGCSAGQNGNPTTDFLIDCTAYKWGIPADWLRAQYVQESDWRQTMLGDRRTETAACFAEYPPQAQISGTDVYESMGISQEKWRCDGSDGAGTEPLRWKSTAFNMDYEASIVRASYDNPNGDRSSWGDSTYQPQQGWLSLCAWFESYPWNNSGQQSYCSSVQNHLANRDWLAYNG